MKTAVSVLIWAVLGISVKAFAQDTSSPLPNAPSYEASKATLERSLNSRETNAITPSAAAPGIARDQTNGTQPQRLGLGGKTGYYVSETYFNPAVFLAPALRSGVRMATPPKHYPLEWRQGAEGFGRNYGDAFAQRVSSHTAQALTGIVAREDPRYLPSTSHNVLARSAHALAFTFIDRSDSGRPMPAFSNFVGAAAGGFVGNAYLSSGFNNITHAGQRSTIWFGSAAGGNLFREFAPQMPKPMRTFLMLFAR